MKMILIENQQTLVVDTDQLEQDALKIMGHFGYGDFDLGILLCDNTHMHNYNKKYREQDKPTDILSFPLYPELKPGQTIKTTSNDDKNLGDIILCPQYIKEDLERWNKTFEERIRILLVHGICHLLGYDHIEDKDYLIMDAKEKELLKMLDI